MQAFILKISLLFGAITWYSSIYSIHITTINGQDKSMEDFKGKKILIVVLPTTKAPNDSAFLRTIDSVSRNYSDRLSIIGVPSIEDGYNSSRLNELKNYYQSILGDRITLTRGMYTKKTSGDNQGELFSWLTHVEKNDHFNDDVDGAGQKFFISERGELYGSIIPEGKLSAKVLHRLVEQ